MRSCLKVVVSVMNDESDPVIVDAGLTVPQVAAVLKLQFSRSLNMGDEVTSAGRALKASGWFAWKE